MRMLVVFPIFAIAAPLMAAPLSYTISVVPLPAGANDAYPEGLDAAGDVFMNCGFWTADRQSYFTHPYVASGGQVLPLPLPAGMNSGEIMQVNAAGVAVGYVQDSQFVYHPALWQNQTVTLLDTGGFVGGYAWYLNGTGQIVGSVSNVFPNDGSHQVPVIWDHGVVQFPKDASGNPLWTGRMNDLGQMVVGLPGFTDLNMPGRIGVLQNGVVQAIDGSPGYNVSVFGINNQGELIGDAATAPDNQHNYPFIVKDGTIIPLVNPVGDFFVLFTGINDAGDAVAWGESLETGGSALMWDGEQFHDLSTLIPADSGWTLLDTASAINDSGQIVGAGGYEGSLGVFLLTPVDAVPEPGSLLMVGFAGVLAVCRSYRKSRN